MVHASQQTKRAHTSLFEAAHLQRPRGGGITASDKAQSTQQCERGGGGGAPLNGMHPSSNRLPCLAPIAARTSRQTNKPQTTKKKKQSRSQTHEITHLPFERRFERGRPSNGGRGGASRGGGSSRSCTTGLCGVQSPVSWWYTYSLPSRSTN